ncbi:lysozyme [Erythrobacter sp. MTPC3]|uniref:lysozyme n=1 Tax=Erythrobacter sp. MTPC3 TaxID=3056564 RepID=UPI0036F20C4F
MRGPAKLRRRRFLREFRERRAERRALRRAARLQGRSASLKARNALSPARKRKRTAMALGVTAAALSGTSQLAMSASPIAAQSQSLEADYSVAFELVDPSERRDVSQLNASNQLLEAMIEEEGIRYDVYRDVAGYPTVGVGHLLLPEDNLRLGDRISHERALDFLESDIAKAEDIVRRLVGDLPINQHEFDALVDLAFNVGEGSLSEGQSPRLNSAIAAADYDSIADQLNYTTAGNRVARGLVYRSERRQRIFTSSDYSDPREA